MASGFLESLSDAKTLQESLRAFDEDGVPLEKECPKTELVFREIVDPDEGDLPPDEIEEEPYDGKKDYHNTKTTIIVRDFCTDQPIPNATLFYRNAVRHADANGRIFLGYIKGGGTENIKIQASGYISTWKDTLDNDVLRIPNAEKTPRAGGSVDG